MMIVERRVVILPATEEGRRYAEDLCHKYRTEDIAYSRENTSSAILIRSLIIAEGEKDEK